MSGQDKPVLRRDLEFVPIEHQGQKLAIVRDPLGLVGEGKAVSEDFFILMAMLDGAHSLEDILEALKSRAGDDGIKIKDVEMIISQLDKSCMLESEVFYDARQKVVDAYKAEPFRQAAFAGVSYPETGEDLDCFLDQVLEKGAEVPEREARAVVSPHIDPRIGSAGYGAAYSSIRGMAPERVVVLGVGHNLHRGLFSFTDKPFTTMLGTTQNSAQVSSQLEASAWEWSEPGGLAHMNEHSIEFQLLFLQKLFGPESFELVPILCGSAIHNLNSYSRSGFQEACGPFLRELESVITPKTLVVAGVDFSHVGPKFGDSRPAKETEREFIDHDRTLLACMQNGDTDGFWAESARVMDRFNVCGFTALATLMEVLGPVKAELLDYSAWFEDETESAVSFAALAY